MPLSLRTLIASLLSPLFWIAGAGSLLQAQTVQAADTTVRLIHPDNDPNVVAVFTQAARQFEASRPGVKIAIQYLEGEAYKKKITTLLQSPDRPHILYSWGGGVMRDQVKAGVIESLSAPMAAGWQGRFIAPALQAYTVDGKVVGVPFQATQVGFWFNKDLFAKAGVDAGTLKTWDDLLGAVKKLKAAGITPIALAGADKWPVHYYWSKLAMRLGGRAPFNAALRGEGAGFEADTFVRAAAMTQQLAELKPFQGGYLGAGFAQTAGQFGDGKAAMILMVDNIPGAMPPNSADKKGVPADKLGWFAFPAVAGGKGDASDTLGGMNGFLVSKGAPKEAVDFLRFFSDLAQQRQAAEKGVYLPVVTGASDALKDPALRLLAGNLARSKYHQLYYDQELGAKAGAVFKDSSVDLITGKLTPAAAAAAVQKAWKAR